MKAVSQRRDRDENLRGLLVGTASPDVIIQELASSFIDFDVNGTWVGSVCGDDVSSTADAFFQGSLPCRHGVHVFSVIFPVLGRDVLLMLIRGGLQRLVGGGVWCSGGC